MARIFVKGQEFTFYKVLPYKAKEPRLMVYGKKGIVSNLDWSDAAGKNESSIRRTIEDRKVMPEGVTPEVVEAKYYRSTLTNVSTRGKGAAVEYRVWIYTTKPEVTRENLLFYMEKLMGEYPTNTEVIEENFELNEPVEEYDGDLNTFYGYAEFKNKQGKVYHYPRSMGTLVDGKNVIVLGELFLPKDMRGD